MDDPDIRQLLRLALRDDSEPIPERIGHPVRYSPGGDHGKGGGNEWRRQSRRHEPRSPGARVEAMGLIGDILLGVVGVVVIAWLWWEFNSDSVQEARNAAAGIGRDTWREIAPESKRTSDSPKPRSEE